MSHLSDEVRDAVLGAILPSECDPVDAVRAALEAVAAFATECVDGPDDFADLARKAWENMDDRET